MQNWLRTFWLGSDPVEFESQFDLTGSVERLSAATGRSAFAALTQPMAVGTVTESRVVLSRQFLMFQNSYKPIFRGRFEERSGKVFLVGRFGMSRFVKLFMALWFGFLSFFLIAALLAEAGFSHVRAQAALLGAPIMLVLVTLLVAGSKWLARNDPSWISTVIRKALIESHDQA